MLSDFESAMKKVVSAIESSAPAGSYRGSAGGFSVEDDVPGPSSGEKGKVYVAVIGWESVEAHKANNQTQAVKDVIPLLRDAKGMVSHSNVHIEATETQAGGIGPEERGAIDQRGSGAGNVQEEVLNPQRGEKVAPKARSDGTTTKNS